MAYVENIAAFLKFATNFNSGRHVFNYVDKPDFNMEDLTDIICKAMDKHKSNIHVPYSVGLLGGYCFDILAKVTGKEFPISSIRIKNSVPVLSLNLILLLIPDLLPRKSGTRNC